MLTSWPLLVAVMTTRSGPESSLRKGPLQEAQLTTASGRSRSLSHRASSPAETSGPRRLKRAVLPSKVPWPIRTSHSGSVEDAVLAASSSCKRWRSDFWPGSSSPIRTISVSPALAAASHRPAHSRNWRPYSSVPSAPTTTTRLGCDSAPAARRAHVRRRNEFIAVVTFGQTTKKTKDTKSQLDSRQSHFRSYTSQYKHFKSAHGAKRFVRCQNQNVVR